MTYLTKNSTYMFGVTFLIMVERQVKGILQGILSHLDYECSVGV